MTHQIKIKQIEPKQGINYPDFVTDIYGINKRLGEIIALQYFEVDTSDVEGVDCTAELLETFKKDILLYCDHYQFSVLSPNGTTVITIK